MNIPNQLIGKYYYLFFCVFLIFILIPTNSRSQNLPKILSSNQKTTAAYLPDFSYAGYHFGETNLPDFQGKIINATDFGVKANDALDDSKALLKAIKAATETEGNVILQLPSGKLILSDILYIERSNFVLRGAGSGENGTEIYCPRPMMYLKDPASLAELREYLTTFDKRQREPENNIDLPFSQYAWSGGFIWTQIPTERVKSYLDKYEPTPNILAKVSTGNMGEHVIAVSEVKNLKIGDIVELQLFNKDGENGEIITDLYKGAKVKPGSHHWNFPKLPIVRQQVEITKISGSKITIKTPLTISIKPSYQAQLVEWKHLNEVGIEHIKFTFPDIPRVAHHVEPGNNAIFLTRIFNSWVKDITITNADSGILVEEVANTTIQDIVTDGNHMAHYTVTLGGVHNILVKNLKIYNKAVHPLSFNTFATKNVYQNCEIFADPVLDQHSGANHQNLFDNITVHFSPDKNNSYALFGGGGADYWKPSHGPFSTFWNLNIKVENPFDAAKPILLYGMKDGAFARIIGVNGNAKFEVKYDPDPYVEFLNQSMEKVPSLYDYQLKKRLK
ncbi:glycosyl hydrolase family 28-related protein [Flavobacterium sp. MC2016-06]|uniref:glycosyl hydrolase family 28-related protein n=1 Tax=Flavobacterium sp. MC2016-06 TaxID=2676308 RepID=UPI0012BA616A|nr:glycosyl hydrolase family 28-related protein [Flavobacterium sp. MC2016-06]MBU3859607.1 glycoside hydrolase family 55 protein [Flavobacterium sp. MC2016-06]